jgi:hypothetical protein
MTNSDMLGKEPHAKSAFRIISLEDGKLPNQFGLSLEVQ